MREWREYKIGDLLILEYGKSLNNYRNNNGKYEVFGTNGKIGFTERYLYHEPSLIIGRKGAYREVHFSAKPFFVIDTAFYTKKRNDLTDTTFMYYWFKNVDINAMDSGSAIPSTSRDEVYELEIYLPSYLEQTKIAEILSSLDDKIDLLHRQNKTLEQLSETLFRQWFVEDRDESWEETTLYECIELIGGGTPKTGNEAFWNGSIPWLSGGDIAMNHKTFVMESEKLISELGLQNSSARLSPKFSTIISARGTVGKYCLLSEPMAFSQSNYGMQPKFKNCFFFTYLLVAYSVHELQAAAYGSVFDTITTNTFKEHKINVPEVDDILEFENTVAPYFRKMLSNTSQIGSLTKLRDTLLPKLMTGQVSIKNLTFNPR